MFWAVQMQLKRVLYSKDCRCLIVYPKLLKLLMQYKTQFTNTGTALIADVVQYNS